MGFFQAMKGANNSWGKAVGRFGTGYIGPKNLRDNSAHELMISATDLKDAVIFRATDIASLKLVAATSQWVKWKLSLKNGFEALFTSMVPPNSAKGPELTMSYQNFEYWMSHVPGLLYN